MLKIKLLFITVVFCFLAVSAKLFLIQVVNSDIYTADYLKTEKVYPERGRIFDRNKKPLAVNQASYLLYAEPKKIKEKYKLIDKLKNILPMNEATLEARIDETKQWVKVTSGLTTETKDTLEKENLKGIGFQYEPKRYYPEASLSAQLIGFVGKNVDSENIGYFGVEGFYEKELGGLTGLIKSERDLFGQPIFFGTQERIKEENGRDLVLTLDSAVQSIAKKKLLSGLEQYDASEGCVIIANPMTMEILALACLPDFDPDKYYLFSEDYFKNPAISNLYEPGSTFKPLVVAAGIEEKKIKPDEFFNEEGPVTIGEYSIKTWNNQYEGKISMTRILEKSSNVGMVYIGEKLGEDKLYDYLAKYGLGEKTDIDLQGEISADLKPKEQWYPIDYATATFGQGIAMTPIQMIRAFSVLVNGGKLMRPYVVKEVLDGDKKREQYVHEVRQVISPRTSEIIKKMLVSTVENGEVKWAKPPGYTIGGKTGTAQIPIKGHYDPSKTIASFIGFAPADNPQFIALVILREPKTSPWGSETAAPLFFEIAKELLVYYNIPPK